MTLSAVWASPKLCLVHGQLSLQSCFVLSQQEQRLNAQGLGDFAADSNLNGTRPAFFHLTAMFTSTTLFSEVATICNYGMTVPTSQRSKKLWILFPTKSLQPVPTIAGDVKLWRNKLVFWVGKMQVWCFKQKGRNIRSQSGTAVMQGLECDFIVVQNRSNLYDLEDALCKS